MQLVYKMVNNNCKKEDSCDCKALTRCKNREGKVVNVLKDMFCSKEYKDAKDEYKTLGLSSSTVKKFRENGMKKCQKEEKDHCTAKSDDDVKSDYEYSSGPMMFNLKKKKKEELKVIDLKENEEKWNGAYFYGGYDYS